jgi:hypothetical protein
MPTRKLVDLMEGTGISRNIFPIIILRESMEGGAPQGQTGSRTTPRPYLPSFTYEPTELNHLDEFDDLFDQYSREYNSLSLSVQRHITLDQLCGLKFRNNPACYRTVCRKGLKSLSQGLKPA